MDLETNEARHYSRKLMCPTTGISYPDPEPNTFSFNSPKGACPSCNGLGTVKEIDMSKVIPDPSLSIKKGGLAPLGEYKRTWIFNQMEAIGERHGFKLETPVKDISKSAMDIILNGSKESFKVADKVVGITRTYKIDFDGLINLFKNN